jgi:NAD(P)-dependent dehydrogenase (short-subunit alcohol dehydrogenase family)
VSAVFITGAAGDIGGAIAEELAPAGWTLVLADQPRAHKRLHAARKPAAPPASTLKR